MKKKIILLFLAFICSIGVWADSVTINASNGTFKRKHGTETGGSWNNYWASTLTTPQITVKTNYNGDSGSGNIFGPANQTKETVTYTADIRSGYGYSFFISSTHIITKVTIQAWAQGGANKITDNTSGKQHSFTSGEVKTVEIACNAQEVINAFNIQNNTAFYANVTVYYEEISPVSTPFCTYGPTTGTFYSGSTDKTKQNSYADKWVSTQTSPQVTISVSGNNLTCPGRTGSSEGASCFFANGGKTYTISVPNSAKITGYTIVGRSYNSNGDAGNDIAATTSEGVSQTFKGSEDKKLEVTGKDLRSTTFTLTGTSAFLRPTWFLIYAENDLTFVADKANISNTKSYMVHGARGDWQYASSEATSLTSTTTFNRTDNTRQIAFIKSATTGNYYAYSVITGKFITSSNTLSDTPEPIFIFETGNADYPFFFSFKSDKSDKNINLTTDPAFAFNTTSTYDAGNQWCLYAAKDFTIPSTASDAITAFETANVTATYKLVFNENVLAERVVTEAVGSAPTIQWDVPAYCTYDSDVTTLTGETAEVNFTLDWAGDFTFSTDYANASWYYLTLDGKYLVYSETGPYALVDKADISSLQSALWAFKGNPYDGVFVMNKAAGNNMYLRFFIPPTIGNDGYVYPWAIGENTNGFTLNINGYYLQNTDDKMQLANECSSTDTDAKYAFDAEEVDYYDLVVEDVLPYMFADPGTNTVLATTINKPFGLSYDTGVMGIYTTYNTNITNKSFTKAQYLAAKSILTSNIVFPQSGKYYLIKNTYNGKYMRVMASASRDAVLCDLTAEQAAKDVSAHFYVSEIDSKPYIMTQGEYLNWVNGTGATGWTSVNKDKYAHFVSTGSGEGAFSLALGNGEGGYASYLGTGYYALTSTESTTVGGSTIDERSKLAHWTFEEVNTLTIDMNTVGSKSYATFCAPFDVTIGSGATAYQVDLDTERDRAVYSAITGNKVPAGAGVLLISDDAETSVTATIRTAGDAFSALVGNDLVGYKFVPAFSYPDETTNWNLVLGNSASTGIGFYKLNGTASPNKAYLPYPHEKSSSVKCLILVPEDDDETGIRTIDNGQMAIDNAAIYNLSGQRVGKLQKGINIVNGKKVIVK
jgi:hypothetical protein